MKIKEILKIGVAFLVFLFVGCSGGSGSGYVGSVETKDSSFLYNTNKTEISGYFTIGLDDILTQNTTYIQEVQLTNFTVDIACGKIAQTFGPENLTFTDNVGQKLTMSVTLNGVCNENSFKIRAEKIITTTYTDQTIAPQVNVEDWSKTFSVQNNYEETSSALEVREIVLTPSSFDIKSPGEIKEIEVVALNSNKELLQKNLTLSAVYGSDTSKDYGSLNSYTISTSTSATSSFNYIAPKSITDINGKQATINVTDNETGLKSYVKINFKVDSTDANSISDYVLKLDAPEKLTITDEQYITVKIVDKNDDTKLISAANVKSASVNILNSSMLKFKDNSSSLNYSNSESKTLLVKSFDKSGVAMVQVKAIVYNGKENVNIEQVFPITILSGPINSISIVYKKTKAYSETAPQYSNIYTVHAVDKYGNPANSGEKIYVGSIVGVTKSADNTNFLYSETGGSISYNGSDVSFSTDRTLPEDLTSSSYKNVLIVLANNSKFNHDYIGGWDIVSRNGANSLSLASEDYSINFTSVSGLTYVIGSEKRYNPCLQSVAVADIDSSDSLYSIGDDGRTDVVLKYDPYLVGKTAYVYVNSVPTNPTSTAQDNRKRVGVAISDVLFGTGVSISPETIEHKNDTNETKTFSSSVSITQNDTGKAVQHTVIQLTGNKSNCIVTPDPLITDSNGITDCNGVAYYKVIVPPNTSCTLSVSFVKDTASGNFD